jgi:hypothetical protein
MIDSIRELQESVFDLKKSIRAVKSKQVTSRIIKEDVRKIVDSYFRNIRSLINETQSADPMILASDATMHSLLEASHLNSSVNTYIQLLKKLDGELIALEKYALLIGHHKRTVPPFEPSDVQIIKTLNDLLPSAGHSYQQALVDLSSESRLSWRGPATDLREALREVLDHLAPDEVVVGQTGFKLDPDTNGPTMKQKVRYILRQRKMNSGKIQPVETAAEAVDEILASFVRSIYTRSSVSTHTPTDIGEVRRVRDLVRVALREILSLA